jgi:antitoxin component YwqK of YwqJK toxin-antitoxin module
MNEKIKDGIYNDWYEFGQKKEEGNYKDGKQISYKQWNEDGTVKE